MFKENMSLKVFIPLQVYVNSWSPGAGQIWTPTGLIGRIYVAH